MLSGILLIILGILAVPSLLLSRKPDAKELLDKITPYQGWIGLGFCFWGVWGIFKSILHMRAMGAGWLLGLAVSVVTAVLGFLLGYGMINKLLLSKNEEAKEKGAALLAKLAPMQGKFGIAAIVLGVIYIVLTIMR